MSDRTPNEIGDALESRVAQMEGARRVPQSGGGKFVKLDVKDGLKFVFSCKASTTLRDTGLRAIAKLWREAVRGTRGLQGHGDGAKPGVVFEVDGETLVMIRLDDYEDLTTGAVELLPATSKAAERRARARQSLLG